MTTLITGAGMVGCHVARLLADRGEKVVLYDLSPNRAYISAIVGARGVDVVAGDVRDLPALVETLREHGVGLVFHTAGLIGGRVRERPYTGFAINVGGAINVAEAARLAGVQRLVYAGTFGAYDPTTPGEGPVDEDAPLGGDNPYGVSKAAAEMILRSYGATYGISTILLRFAGIYGPGHYVGGSAVGRAMHELAQAAAAGRPCHVSATRLGWNEYVYIKDVARGVVLACDSRDTPHRVFNLGTGVLSGPEEVAAALRLAAPQAQVEVETGPAEELGPRRSRPLSIRRAQAELGYSPQFDLAQGLSDYVATLREGGVPL